MMLDPVTQFDLDGNVIAVFSSLAEAARQTGLESGCISNNCLGRTRCAGDYQWRFGVCSETIPRYEKYFRKRPVTQYDLNGDVVAHYHTVSEAAKTIGIGVYLIKRACNSENCLAGGYQWRFGHETKKITAYKTVIPSTTKTVLQCDLKGKVVARHLSLGDAARATGIDPASISRCCNNYVRRKTAGGFIWKFEKNKSK